MNLTRESTHYIIVANIWIATGVLAEHTHDIIFAGALGLFWFLYGIWLSKKERDN